MIIKDPHSTEVYIINYDDITCIESNKDVMTKIEAVNIKKCNFTENKSEYKHEFIINNLGGFL